MATKSEIRKLADAAEAAVDALRDLMQEHFDEKSERWQTGDAGSDWQDKIDGLENVIDANPRLRPRCVARWNVGPSWATPPASEVAGRRRVLPYSPPRQVSRPVKTPS